MVLLTATPPFIEKIPPVTYAKDPADIGDRKLMSWAVKKVTATVN